MPNNPFGCSCKKFFLISNLNLPWRNFSPFPLVLSPSYYFITSIQLFSFPAFFCRALKSCTHNWHAPIFKQWNWDTFQEQLRQCWVRQLNRTSQNPGGRRMPNVTLQPFQAVRNQLLIYRVLPVLKSLGNACAKVTFTASNEAYTNIRGNRNC